MELVEIKANCSGKSHAKETICVNFKTRMLSTDLGINKPS
jgi:hypothetical protein